VAVAKGEMKVIVVAAFFPPAGGVGTFRVRKFVKYLSEFGVSPAVVTMTVDEYSRIGWQMDAEGLGDVPTGVAVYRSDAAKVPFVRDIGIRWTFSLLRKLRLAVKRERPDLLMFTGDPFFPMIWGVYFKLFYGLPYVLDFRDPWALAGRDGSRRSAKLRLVDLVTNIVEALVLRYCAYAIVVSEEMRTQYQRNYNALKARFVVITNGYDPDDYSEAPVDRRAGNGVIYAGKFRMNEKLRNPKELFRALKMLKVEGVHLDFVHIGTEEPEIVSLARESGLDGNQTRFEGYLPLRETIGCIKGAKIAVLIGGGQASEQTTKVFDYMACGVPILAIGRKDSSAGRILLGYKSSIVVNNDAVEIASALRGLLRLKPDGRRGLLPVYSRRNLAGQLSELFAMAIMDKRKNGVVQG